MSRVDNDLPDGFEPHWVRGVVVRGRRRLAAAAVENRDGRGDAGGLRGFFVFHDRDQHFEGVFGVGAGKLADRLDDGFRRRSFQRDSCTV
jgi:hypothetical protein